MPHHAKSIYVNFEGDVAKINYLAGGYGYRVSGYFTSLHQVHSALRKHFCVSGLTIYTLVHRRAVCISSERVLKQVLSAVPSGGYLMVYAYRLREMYKSYDYSEYPPLYRTNYYPEVAYRRTRRRRTPLERKYRHHPQRLHP